jgi:hypothetical protein
VDEVTIISNHETNSYIFLLILGENTPIVEMGDESNPGN